MVDVYNWVDLSHCAITPTGISIEGIRIDTNTPVFSNKRFIAFANMTGEKAPKTNVARSNINSGNLEKHWKLFILCILKIFQTKEKNSVKNFP